ncbi:MAG TPA: MFS transporter [Pseudonocardia sp.]|jgi:MHS family proline/betaine transporter-like MFS transporter|uniref:MFS transporter n=1 Tax=Pseudonocardia sp. TaxID=60912 RepID=UPI002B4B06DF|nr:MFS transporter [Pseudonocardia sp.]HLU54524.1 MFS transporter [Pseudonocardia sp.]
MATEQHKGAHEVDERTVRKAVGAAAMGNLVEWFDYGIYSYVAIYIAMNFFPGGDEGANIALTFALFAVAYLVRPLGGTILGPLGDRIGRKRVLALTIVVMSGASFAIGLLPTFDAAGWVAPILLVIARLVQGFATGGEYGGAAAFIAEYAPDRKRGFYCSFLEFGTTGGFVLAAGMVTVLQLGLSPEAMASWGWRIPFLIAGPLGLVGLYLRSKLEDTPAFLEMEESHQVSESPLKETIVHHWRPVLICMGLVLFYNVAVYTILFYMPTYLQTTLGLEETPALLYILGMMLMIMFVIIPVGALSDRVGRKPLIVTACVGFIVLGYPSFMLLAQGTVGGTVAGLAILGLLLVMLLGTMSATLPALFATDVRYGGFSIGYNLSTSIFGGTAPFILETLVLSTGNNAMPGIYLVIASVISMVAVIAVTESARKPLPGVSAALLRPAPAT